MWEFDDVGCSANDRRWQCLLRLAETLSEGKVELDQLVREVEKNKSDNNKADREISKKSNNVDVVSANELERSGKKSGLKITFKIDHGKVANVVCSQEPVSKKITFKKPSKETSMESATMKNNLDRNPTLSKGKRSRKCFENEEGLSEKNAKKIRSNNETPTSFRDSRPVDIPEAVKNHILDSGGCLESLVLVIQKSLYQTDVSTTHARLSIPRRKVMNEFLTSTDVDELDSSGILVNLVQPCLEECQMSLRNWKSNSIYALVADWNEVCRKNGLEQDMIIQLWSFRRNSALCFALVRID